MATFQKTFRKSGSHHAEFQSLQGVQVKIGEKYRPPRKVTLPVGWQQKDPSIALGLFYDSSLERDVISKVEALKASKQKQLESAPDESKAANESEEALVTPSTSNSIFSNVGSEILQPVVACGTGHKKKDSFGGKGKNAFDISDFEGDTSTPFELVELQTINDMDELKNVLQSNAAVTAATDNPSTCNGGNTSVVSEANSSGSSANLSTNSGVSSTENSLVNISGLNLAERTLAPVSAFPNVNLTSSNPAAESGALLVNFEEPQTSVATPAVAAVSNLSTSPVQNNPLSNVSPNPENRPFSRGAPLPPIGQTVISEPQQTQVLGSLPAVPKIPPRSSTSGLPVSGRVGSFPNTVNPSQESLKSIHKEEIERQTRQESSPSYMTWNLPRSSDHQNGTGCYPSPLPPIGMSNEETYNKQSCQSSLPDPWPVLNDIEKEFAQKFVSMGFPTPRVARAVQRLGTTDRKVIEFLMDVEELSGNGTYSHDSVEVALVFNPEKEKAVEFLKLVETFKEYGFKEDSIHECLQATGNDREKTLDYLMSLPSA